MFFRKMILLRTHGVVKISSGESDLVVFQCQLAFFFCILILFHVWKKSGYMDSKVGKIVVFELLRSEMRVPP